MKLKDRSYIVTGSSMGIGESIARRIVKEGGKVLIHGWEAHATQRGPNPLACPIVLGILFRPIIVRKL